MPSDPSFLIVKTSSLGDVIHNLPVIADIKRHLPDAQIDWVCEAPYADLLRLNANIRNVLPINLRHLKRHLFSLSAWRAFFSQRRNIARQSYQRIIDTQGLIKSAALACAADGPRAGYTADSAREPLASRFYSQRFSVARNQHAVVRNRALVAAALDYAVEGDADYGLSRTSLPRLAGLSARYVVFLHATSRQDKRWPNAHWISLGRHFNEQGISVVAPWGTLDEREESRAIVAALADASVPEAMTLSAAAALLAHAELVIGVDTGLAHLAVAVATPTIGIYISTDSALTGLYGASAENVGGIGQMPAVDAIVKISDRLMRPA